MSISANTEYSPLEEPGLAAFSNVRSVLVTGAAGLVGAEVVRLLVQLDVPVFAVDLAPSPEAPGVTSIVCDLADEQALRTLLPESIDIVIHAGGISGPMVAPHDPVRVVTVNGLGTTHMLEIARERGCSRFVFVSSGSVFGEVAGAELLGEEVHPHPSSVYGAMKVAGEALVDAYRAQHGLSAVSVRPVHVYGVGRATQCPINEMVALASKGGGVEYPMGAAEYRDYVYVTDVARALLYLAVAEEPLRPSYNIDGKARHTATDVARAVEEVVGGVKFEVGDESDPHRAEIGGLDGSAILEDVGFAPRFTLLDGIRDYVARVNAT